MVTMVVMAIINQLLRITYRYVMSSNTSGKTAIWNPIHMDENGQNGTYMSEHGTDMSVHVYACSYNHERVQTCT